MARLNKDNLKDFPQDVQTKVLDILKAYNKVTVSYEYGVYNVSTGSCIKAVYGEDHEVYGDFHAEDIYTIEERTENYIESFHEYPIWYKGKRDYQALKERFNK
jgi:hypothetical protein